MREYRRAAHTVYCLHYHFVFITKYRKPVLRGDIGREVRELIREICRTHDIEILQGHVQPEHVHLLLSVPPHVSPSPRESTAPPQAMADCAAEQAGCAIRMAAFE